MNSYLLSNLVMTKSFTESASQFNTGAVQTNDCLNKRHQLIATTQIIKVVN